MGKEGLPKSGWMCRRGKPVHRTVLLLRQSDPLVMGRWPMGRGVQEGSHRGIRSRAASCGAAEGARSHGLAVGCRAVYRT